MSKPKYTTFQWNSINDICNKFKSSGRVFLADEAGLGKTVTAAGVMDKIYKDEYEETDEVMYVLYVAPSFFIAQNACKKFIGKSCNENMIQLKNRKKFIDERKKRYKELKKVCELYIQESNQKSITEMIKACELFIEKSCGASDRQVVKACQKFIDNPENIQILIDELSVDSTEAFRMMDMTENRYKQIREDKKIVILPLSANVLGGKANSKGECELIYEYYKKLKNLLSNTNQEVHACAITELGNVIEKYEKDKECYEKSSIRAEITRFWAEYDILLRMKPRLIIWDEFHRYKEFLNVDNAFFQYEKVINEEKIIKTNMLFLSATPYHSNIGGNNKKLVEEDYDEVDINQQPLPSFKDFAKLCGKEEELLNKSEKYTKALADFLLQGNKDSFDNLKKQKCVVEEALRRLMIRHERTQMNGYIKEEFEELFDSVDIYDDSDFRKLKNEYKEVFSNSWYYFQNMNGQEKLARDWAINMPYIYSFSKESGNEKAKKFECFKPSGVRELYLSKDPAEYLEQIKAIKTNTLAFHEIIKANIAEDKELLLWIPPAFRKYDPGKESIFIKHKNHSKLLIFAENVCFQRGIPFLLSEYVDCWDICNQSFEDVNLRYADKENDLQELAAIKISDKGENLEEIVNALPEEWSLSKKYAAIAAPAVCAYRLTNDIEIAKRVEAAFNTYFNQKSIKIVLNRWRKKYANEISLKEAVLKYCCEGNLESVLDEWSMHKENIFDNVEDILNKTIDITPLKWDSTCNNEVDSCRKICKFSFRLSPDREDNGGSNTASKIDEKEKMVECFSSPFWPMIMVTGKGAQESMDFHTYCMRIMHFTIPKGAVSKEQREGRIDRYDSLMIKRRAAVKVNKCDNSIKDVLKRLSEEKGQKGDLYPHWMLKDENSSIKFQRILAFWPYTDQFNEWNRMNKMLNTYRSVFGSIESHERVIKQISRLNDKDCKIEDIIINLNAPMTLEKDI